MDKALRKSLEELVAHKGETLKGGNVLSAKFYEDADGEKRIVAVIDYGIKGVKKFDASMRELDVANKRAEPGLEQLQLDELKRLAVSLGLNISDANSRVTLIVRIKQKLMEDAKAEILAELEAEEETEEKAEHPFVEMFGEAMANELLAAGFETVDDLAGASVNDLKAVKGVGKKTAEKILAAVEQITA